MKKKNKEVGFHVQIHSSRVDKHVSDIRLVVDSKHVSQKYSKILHCSFTSKQIWSYDIKKVEKIVECQKFLFAYCFVLADDTIALEVASFSEILNFIILIIQP